ncbi:Hydrogen peroxide-inducible genes activator [Nitrospira japonica]|uniref:Hydrogen peroxide-inducible genes activator n=1 Tax=Nitrospira japonica TaxID=1325564 RepID=A0A1W1I0K0_9BACT|nr:LysR substrate-binding domain-containing protein [Nitrospira japonica]SLM46521.1 Hydrogen peroxide-inducible genes activator [Nitrospira japonica]
MTLTELKYLVAVAQERHFGRAAERCHISQPALSLAIRKLEEELGTSVLERRKNQITLTALGEKVVQQAQRVLEAAEQIPLIVAQGKDQLVGVFKLGVIATVGPYILPDLIPLLHRRAPSMPLEIEENLTVNLNQMLQHGQLDAIIVALPHEETGILTQPLYEEPFKVVIPVTHPWAKKKRIETDDLGTEKVILPHAGHCFRRQLLDHCPEISRSDREGIQGNSLETIRQMVASGLGITVLPCSALSPKHHHKRLLAIPFTDPVPERQIGLAWRKGFARPAALEAIQETVRLLKIPGLTMQKESHV